MKLKKLITTVVLLTLSVTMALCATACGGKEPSVYTVTLDANGGSIPNNATSVQVTVGESYTLPTPTKTGYVFNAWETQNGAVEISGTWTIESDVSVTAKWTAKTTTVTLDVNGGVGATATTITATYGQVLSLPTLTKAGYNFAGWKLAGSAYNASNVWTVEDATATLVATWTAKTTAVTLTVNGGVGASETQLQATYGEVLTLPTLTKVGYNFAGWTLNGNAYDATSTWALETATATLVANWTAKTTAVTLTVNGGVGASETTLTATYGEALTLPTLTKVGYNFAGWTLNGSAYDVTAAWALEDATATLVANWTAKTTAVTLTVNGGVGASETTLTATYGQVLTLPTLTKVGYNFAGWTLNGNAYDATAAWALEAATATLVANWTAKTTQVTLTVNGGVGASETTLTATYGQVLTLPTLTKVGYNFAGWTLNGSAFNTANAWALEDATATLVANWTAKTTTVTLDVAGGTGATETTLTATYGQVLELPTLTKAGFKFAGWKLNGNAYDVSVAWALEDATATLVATWTEKGTTVTLNLDGGSYDGDTTIMAIYGQVLTLKTPTKVGFNFAGWTLNGSAFNTANAWSLEDETATLVATWTAKTTVVTLTVNGGVGASQLELTATYGQVLALPTLTKEGYNFAGWTLNGNPYNASGAWLLEDATAEIVANWTVKTTAVTLTVNGGVGATETTLQAVCGQVLELPTLTKVGYNFAGWTLNGNPYDVESTWALEDETAELVANWTAKTMNVTFNVDGGAAVNATTFTYGVAPYASESEIPTTTKQYYNFVAWLYNGEVIDLTAAWLEDVESIELVASYEGVKVNVTIKYEGYESDVVEVTYGAPYAFTTDITGMKIGSLVIEDTETAVEISGDAWLNGEVTLVATLAPKTFNVTVKGYSGNTLGTFVATYGQKFNLMPYMPSNDSVVFEGIGQKYFDGFRIEGLEVKFVAGSLENLVWNYDFDGEDVVLVATYESDDIWIL